MDEADIRDTDVDELWLRELADEVIAQLLALLERQQGDAGSEPDPGVESSHGGGSGRD
jgi:hypothetical protein